MDHLERTPLLLEFALPSKQRLKGAPPKQRTRRQSRSALMSPDARGAENIVRRISDRQRMNQARDLRPSHTKRKAKSDHAKRRAPIKHGEARKNPQAKSNTHTRGNPQAKAKTKVRVSPSNLKRRPTIPNTRRFFGFGNPMKGR